MTISVLTVTMFETKEHEEIEDQFNMYFSTVEKAQEFITNNFKYDNVRKISADYYEGKLGKYIIQYNVMVDQENF